MNSVSRPIYVFFFSIITQTTGAFAGSSIEYVSTSNPGLLKATVFRSCADVNADLDKKFQELAGRIPYVSSVAKVMDGTWEEKSRSGASVSQERRSYLSVQSTLNRDFPMTVFALVQTKRECVAHKKADAGAKGAPGGSGKPLSSEFAMLGPIAQKDPDASSSTPSCESSYSSIITGSEAVVYQNTIELNRSTNVFGSFVFEINLADDSKPGQCVFETTLRIQNTAYLWAKRKLIGEASPETVQEELLKGFVKWSKMVLSVVEG